MSEPCDIRAARPARYHRRASLLWQAALRRLVGKGLTDARIAELLSGLNEAALRQLDREGWILDRVEDLHVTGSCPLPWTARSVGYHRRRLGLPANHAGLADANARKAVLHRLSKPCAAWWHLFPDPDNGGAGWELWETECRMLSLLCEHGPMTRGELLSGLGRTRILGPRGRSIFSRLVEARLIEMKKGDAGHSLFVLSDKAILPETGRLTSIETRFG